MEFIADLHIHSKYAMACSNQLTLENMNATAKEKGIGIMGTGDFTHPRWLSEIKNNLEDSGGGLYTLKGGTEGTRFALSSEVCTIFEDRSGKSRRIHHCILAPSVEIAEQVNMHLSKFGDLASDGRPVLNKITPAGLVEELFRISEDIFVFPAHLWTPWFGALGAFSGFNSIDEVYEDQARHVHAYETGLSSDPPMNWRISSLDKYTLISGSDAHSLPKMGREAIIIDMEGNEVNYKEFVGKIKNKELKLTLEFYPEEGKYHFDGHRNCSMSLTPEEAGKYGDVCPKCGKRLTIGVLHRVNALADREDGSRPEGAAPYVHAIPLQEVIAYVTKKSQTSTYVQSTYAKLIQRFGTEMNILLKSRIEEISETDKELGRAIRLVREDRANVIPGYDGVFGIIDIFNEAKEKGSKYAQKRITEF
ncbi:MAG: endonuclease Q family protein [Candidatus Micrarchaeaceae archaeon]